MSIFDNKCVDFRLTADQKDAMSVKLISLRNYFPAEFARKPRTFTELSRWKATEYRQFALYSGIVVLKDIISSDLYYHFLLLHCAYRILSCSLNYLQNTECAQELLEDFVKNYSILYGKDQLSYNVHCLLHITDCCKQYGPVDSFTAYKFENYMQHLKKLIRKPSKIPQQLQKRFLEHVECKTNPQKTGTKKLIKVESGYRFYSEIDYEFFKLTTKSPDNCCCLQICDERIIIEVTEIL